MRFPDIPVMYRVFDLFRARLDIESKFVDYQMADAAGHQVLDFNAVRHQQKVVNENPKEDWFKDSTKNQGLVPTAFVDEGVNHWISECFEPFRKAFVEDWDKGWNLLMEYDQHSARSFMGSKFNDEHVVKKAYPDAAINWLERMSTGTGLFDMAFSEMVIDDLQFDFPTGWELKYGGAVPPIEWKWYCLAGGSEVFINAMVEKIKTKPKFSKRVTRIVPTDDDRPISVTYVNNKVNSVPKTTQYDYVISTMPLPNLRFVDLDKCNLSYAQTQALRSLRYDASVKVGLKFRTRWWQELQQGPGTGSIKGGQTKTDRIVRTVVYPSYGIDDPNADAVMIASYTWSQDAQRVGGLVNGYNTVDEKLLIDLVLGDLAVLHGFDSLDFLHDQLEDYYACDWHSQPFSLGAFALFGPGQFGGIYSSWGQSAAGGRLLFAGEALSEQHAWVEGALESAYWAVYKMLCGAGLTEKIADLKRLWGNPNYTEEEEEEQSKVMRNQEYLGALLSTVDDREELSKALNGQALKEDLQKLLSQIQV